MFVEVIVIVIYCYVCIFCFVAAMCMGVGVCIYPLGWDSPQVRAICGATAARFVQFIIYILCTYTLIIIFYEKCTF